MNKETLSLLQQLAPDLMEKLMLRAMVLERISALQPVGRRALAQRLHMPEREIRSVCDALKEDGLISVAASGMALTDRALAVLPGAHDMVRRKSALGQLEQHLSRILGVNRLCIVPGNADGIHDHTLHWVVVYGYEGDEFLVCDPLSSKIRITAEALENYMDTPIGRICIVIGGE